MGITIRQWVQTALVAAALFAAVAGCGSSGDTGASHPAVASGPRCKDLPATCGPAGRTNCCSSSLLPAGTFNRDDDPNFPATVSDFQLDTYEVTVGRFRPFVAAYSPTMIAAGAGKNPNDPDDSGWDSAWNDSLPQITGRPWPGLSVCGFTAGPAWTDVPGANENLPINCVSWYEAFAFCAWDGGRLPTEAERTYAAAGGSEQRTYPWSVPPSNTSIDETYAVYCNGSCSDLQKVGSKSPKGDGRWGQSDLGGNVSEWVLDWYADPYPQASCKDCANLNPSEIRAIRGGSFNDAQDFIAAAGRIPRLGGTFISLDGGERIGLRCARKP